MNRKLPIILLIAYIIWFCLLAIGPYDAVAQNPADLTGYKLIWSDEFNGSTIDPNHWRIDTGNGPNHDGFGSWSLEYYTARTDNVFISNGALAIRAVKEEYAGSHFTSGEVTTKGKFAFKYGRIEARIKLPKGYGLWPGFCMYGDDQFDHASSDNGISWPACGEIDVMEMRGGDSGDSNRTIMGTVHFGHDMPTWKYESKSVKLPGNANFCDDYHIFGVVWDAEKIVFQLDGKDYYTNYTTSKIKDSFRKAFYFYYNIKIGGQFFNPHPPTADQITATPQTMMIDWVRVYQKE